MVHGELILRRRAGARDGCYPELSSAARQAGADGRHGGYRTRGGGGLLEDHWSGRRIVELEGPHRITPNDIAVAFSKVLGRPVRAELVPRESWEALFASQGMKNPMPRIQMLDGFNQGWIAFEGGEASSLKGTVDLEEVLQGLVERAPA